MEVIRAPANGEYEEITEWLGGEFDPEQFDVAHINEALKTIK